MPPMVKVLVVDDSSLIRQQISRPLVAAGFETVGAGDGLEALARLDDTPGISLVMSDVNMPRMGGMELLERMRADDELRDVKFLLVTSEAQADFVARAKELGVMGWLRKPLKAESLVATVRKLTAEDER